jgi:peroxiredoxin
MKLIFSVLFTFGVFYAQAQTTGYSIGDPVADFTLTNTVDGNSVSLFDYMSKEGVIVVFTCIHCPCSQAYEQRIMDLDKKYAKLGYPVVAINSNDPKIEPVDSPENMKKRAEDMKYTFPYLFDETQMVARTFGAVRTPHIFLLQKTSAGFVVSYIGAIDDNQYDITAVNYKYVENAIDALRNNKQPDPAFTKAIGCTIKWKQG